MTIYLGYPNPPWKASTEESNGLRCKIFMLDLPTKMTLWLSDFLVGRIIQVNVHGFLSNQIKLKTGVPQGSVLSPLLFLISATDFPKPHHKQNSLSQFADDTAQWAFSLNIRFAAKLLQQDLGKTWECGVPINKQLNPEKTKVIIFSRSVLARKTEPNPKTVWRDTKSLSSSEIFRNYFRLTTHFPKTL